MLHHLAACVSVYISYLFLVYTPNVSFVMDVHHIKTTVILEQDIKSIASLPYSATKSGETSPLPVWKERIHTFSWQWHIVVMATGTCSSLIHNFPYHNESLVLKAVALSLFLFDLVLFFLLCAWAVTRCTMFPKDRMLMFTDPATSLFIGFFTNGIATLINAALSVNRDWGTGSTGFLYALWGLWWLDCILSCLVAFGLVYVMIGQRYNDLAQVRPTWMVPVITLITMSASGGLFTRSLLPHSPTLALLSVSISITMLAIGLSFTMMLTTAFLLRLYLHGPLDATMVLSTFTTLTPLGQGGFSMLINGQDVSTLFAQTALSDPARQLGGQIVYSVCICGAYVLWSMGLAWVAVAAFSICKQAKELPRFKISHWCIVVPNGVFASLSLQLATALNSSFFRAFGAVWACIVFVLWTGTFVRSIIGLWDGSIFAPPNPATTAAASLEAGASTSLDELEKNSKLDLPEQIEVFILPEGLTSEKGTDRESIAETLCVRSAETEHEMGS
ncbi:hypothetical protein PHLGIDRAFT_186260 [Phlebiopsis gigantea 11061_1 CR5-6]|uniref:C4-dicarboxylate transporter/malic acid transport protein n=1 Tax=Phlebiopsis gigantea (strain 11061_1 CR5-6) TaxID=745531 RepID=A0A0C3SEU2_PHLG1|nr:hypothetical protein PHLGIDRAFT_186260 [Phlebiopsis gigantea 11061_1 CR5-6]